MTHKFLMHAATSLALIASAASVRADLASPLADQTWTEGSAAVAASSWDPGVQPASRSGTAFALASSNALGDRAALASGAVLDASALPSSSSTSLWTFITSVRAQQRGDTFSVLETNLSLVLQAEALPPSQVPLPAAAWFLLMGLLGMAGVRLTGHGRQRSEADIPAADPQPLPA